MSVSNLKNSFALIAFIACLNTYIRADCNLPLYAFAYALWDENK